MRFRLLCVLLCACDGTGALRGLKPLLVVDDKAVDFGGIEVLGTAQKKLTLHNTGKRPLTFSNVLMTGHDAFSHGLLPGEIRAGDSAELVFTFAPERIGTFSAQLTFTTTDPENAHITVPLSGEGVALATIDYGHVITGRKRRQTISETPIALGTVTKPACATAPDTDIFVVSGQEIAFRPPCAGDYSARLRTMLLVGVGVADCTKNEDVYAQRDPIDNKVDVLFVIDDSASAAWYQDAIRTSANVFFQALLAGNSDFHVGITTTSYPMKRGALVATLDGKKVVTRAMENASPGSAQALFATLMGLVGTAGRSDESGLAVMASALTTSDRTYSDGMFAFGPGAADFDFLRTDAGFYGIVVSDADDITGAITQTNNKIVDTATYIRALAGLPPDFKQNVRSDPANHFGVYAVIDPGITEHLCPGVMIDNDGTPHYHDAIASLGALGTIISLCSDFDATLTRLGRAISKAPCTFTLQHLPPALDEAHDLCIDGGSCLAPSDVAFGDDGSVTLSPSVCPAGGATFRAHYQTCLHSLPCSGDACDEP